MNTEEMAVIFWKNTETGAHGKGHPIPRKLAEAVALDANSRFPKIIHTVIPVDALPATLPATQPETP